MAGANNLLDGVEQGQPQWSGRSLKGEPSDERRCCHYCCVCVGVVFTCLVWLVLIWNYYQPGARPWPYRCEDDGISCRELSFSGFAYQCRFAGEQEANGDVLLLHGFPEWSDMYNGLMLALAAKGYRSVACNQRGYSPGARPDDVAEYNYDLLRDDVFAMADAAGFSNFHLIGHDHGAVLGWHTVQSDRGRSRILSYNSQSIPHPSALGAALYGDEADVGQQVASQYFTIFPLENSASIKGKFMHRMFGRFNGFESAAAFQKALYWYNGAFEVGILPMPPAMSFSEIRSKSEMRGAGGAALLRWIYGGEPDEGTPAKLGPSSIPMPVLYVCGSMDIAILCATPTAQTTEDYVQGNYTYLEVECGHEVLEGCDKQQEVIDASIALIESAMR